MPELPDLAQIEATLQASLTGRRVIGARTGDPLVLRLMLAEPLGQALVGRRLLRVDRRGHFMRFQLEGDRVIVINAMLVGRYRLRAVPPPGAAAARAADPRSLGLALELEGGIELQYLDDKRMGKVYVAREADERDIPVYGELGVDVVSPDFTREVFTALLRRRRDQVRMFLMDKRALASIGNAYADEILFAARIHPKTFCHKLAPQKIEALYLAIPSVLRHAIAEIAGRAPATASAGAGPTRKKRTRAAGVSSSAAAPISSPMSSSAAEPIPSPMSSPAAAPASAAVVDWDSVKVRDFLSVRGRDGKPCPRCGTTIRAVRVGDGDACFCPQCQPAARKLFVDWGNLPPR
jgi:formamidopyrimidine-DNA glycosylase